MDERYRLEPKDENASAPRVVEIEDPQVQYAFRIRARNLLGQVGEWSPETVVTPLAEAPTVLPVVSPQQGALLGDAIPYQEYINLRKGQDTLVGVNLFNIDGGLENSLFDRDDITIRWTASIGDLDDQEARSTIYTAPHRVGDFAVRVTISQAIPGGAVQKRLRIPVRVIGEGQDVKISIDGTNNEPSYPSEASYRGEDYSVATYDRGGRFRCCGYSGSRAHRTAGVHTCPRLDRRPTRPRLRGNSPATRCAKIRHDRALVRNHLHIVQPAAIDRTDVHAGCRGMPARPARLSIVVG